jgi:methylamine dehydrogenase heavy chain
MTMRGAAWLAGLVFGGALAGASAAEWDSIRGSVADVGEPTAHWFTVRGRHIGYLVDGDAGEVKGSMTLSLFSPALRPHLEQGRIYAYGSYYTRTYYGDRTDVVLMFDAKSLAPVGEVEIPPKSAGIGHSGMIGLVDGRFVGVWNITPAMSVSVVDVEQERFVGEISTPGCAAVYPVGRGFLMPCGDGALQYVALNADGTEASRVRSRAFYDVQDDPVFDYAVPTADGWLFVSFEGHVFEATVADGAVVVAEPWSLLTEEDREAGWRIGGDQPFAYNAETGLLVTLMHEGGGQETFEDGGTEVWGFSTRTRRRGYRIAVGDGDGPERASGVQLTEDGVPLLLIAPDDGDALRIHDGRTGRHLRSMPDLGGLIQNL